MAFISDQALHQSGAGKQKQLVTGNNLFGWYDGPHNEAAITLLISCGLVSLFSYLRNWHFQSIPIFLILGFDLYCSVYGTSCQRKELSIQGGGRGSTDTRVSESSIRD